ncbi:hypothetical protein EYF80_034642 [Liparis tanakae]|uniref:Uncharacterized protein n=1 Tax=Liparis tanakae TaxID=230148 RepID=A0A4Z2GNA9_9TELE|nr:hypothetical protein EYF80_034642 [Liparis tanakae]
MKIEGPSESLDVGWQREASAGRPTSANGRLQLGQVPLVHAVVAHQLVRAGKLLLTVGPAAVFGLRMFPFTNNIAGRHSKNGRLRHISSRSLSVCFGLLSTSGQHLTSEQITIQDPESAEADAGA